jgi:hypothetical protein
MDIGRKQLQGIERNTFAARPDFDRFGVFHKLTRGRLDGKALSIVKHNGWGLLLCELGQDAANRIRFAESTFAEDQHVRIRGAICWVGIPENLLIRFSIDANQNSIET